MGEGNPPMTLMIEAAGITHRGTVRENNEDCIAIGYWFSQETMSTARTFDHALDLPFSCVVAAHAVGDDAGKRQIECVVERAGGLHGVLGYPVADGDAVLVVLAHGALVRDAGGFDVKGHFRVSLSHSRSCSARHMSLPEPVRGRASMNSILRGTL